MRPLLAEVRSRFGFTSKGKQITDHILAVANWKNDSKLTVKEKAKLLDVSEALVDANQEMILQFQNDQTHGFGNRFKRCVE